jgi:Zn-dependent peptidase ImmA (M78 family)
MSRLYVYQVIGKLVRRYGTRDPFELMDAMHVQVRFYYDLTRTKGFTRYFLRQYFAGINGNLPASEQRVVAAHELGHIVLHAEALKTAPLFDTAVYDKRSNTEYEANLFAADLLLADEDVLECVQRPDADFGALCLSMDVSPGLMNFKLRSMQKRGIDVPLVSECDSRFLY